MEYLRRHCVSAFSSLGQAGEISLSFLLQVQLLTKNERIKKSHFSLQQSQHVTFGIIWVLFLNLNFLHYDPVMVNAVSTKESFW